MRTLGAATLAALLWCGCGGSPSTDAGIDAGGSATGGGGAATGGGGGALVDAGPVDAGSPEVLHFMIVDGQAAAPVPQAGVRVEGTGFAVDGVTDAEGRVEISIPPNKRPISVTAARLDYGAFSIVGITAEVPETIRLDALIAPQITSALSVTITGRSDAGTPVVLDSFDFSTARFTSDTFDAGLASSSSLPLPLVAMELDATPTVINWAVTPTLSRDAGAQTIELPRPPAATTSTAWAATLGTGTVGTSTTLVSQGTGWKIAPSPSEETSWVVTGVSDSVKTNATISGTLSAITGPYAPDRFVIQLTDQSQAWLLRYRVHEISAPFTFTVPDFTALEGNGTSLGDLAGHATADGAYDTFCLMVQNAAVPSQAVWRVCTAPGAPFAIAALPGLPGGATPSGLNIAMPGAPLSALPLLVDFEDASVRVWGTVNAAGPVDAARVTLGGRSVPITGAWR